METTHPGVLFVCMGNICRSPTAEGVFRFAAKQRGCLDSMTIDSAGTLGLHAGEPPDRRAIMAAQKRGYDISMYRARPISEVDFERHNWIIAMDLSNLRSLQELCPLGYSGHLGLLLDLVPNLGIREVPDPYYGGAAGFERVLDLVEIGTAALLERIDPTSTTVPRQ
ncbi:MAG: low molecular weight protein-tyrosine-phosphatase [Casimicrobiaceae bacterium]